MSSPERSLRLVKPPATVENNPPALQTGGGGGTFGGMEVVDAKIAAAEARTDTKFAELLGELKLMNRRLDHVEQSTSGTKVTVVGTGIGVLALTIAVMAYGGQWFGAGMEAQQIADRASQNAIATTSTQFEAMNTRYMELDTKIDKVLQAISREPQKQSGDPIPQFLPVPAK